MSTKAHASQLPSLELTAITTSCKCILYIHSVFAADDILKIYNTIGLVTSIRTHLRQLEF